MTLRELTRVVALGSYVLIIAGCSGGSRISDAEILNLVTDYYNNEMFLSGRSGGKYSEYFELVNLALKDRKSGEGEVVAILDITTKTIKRPAGFGSSSSDAARRLFNKRSRPGIGDQNTVEVTVDLQKYDSGWRITRVKLPSAYG